MRCTRNKVIKVTEVVSNTSATYKTSTAAAKATGITGYKFIKIARNPTGKHDEYVRNDKGVLYHIEFIFDVVVTARSENPDQKVMSFSSANHCFKFFGITGPCYYKKVRGVPVGVESPRPVTDQLGTKWYLTLRKPILKDKNFYEKKHN
jgi:hypothetical protein